MGVFLEFNTVLKDNTVLTFWWNSREVFAINTGEVGFEKSLYQEPSVAHFECLYRCQDKAKTTTSFRDESAKIRLQDKIQEAHILIDKVKTTLKDIRLGMTIKNHHVSGGGLLCGGGLPCGAGAEADCVVKESKTTAVERSPESSFRQNDSENTEEELLSEFSMQVPDVFFRPPIFDLNTDSSSSIYQSDVYEGDDGNDLSFDADYLNTIEEMPEPETSEDDRETEVVSLPLVEDRAGEPFVVAPPLVEDSRAEEPVVIASSVVEDSIAEEEPIEDSIAEEEGKEAKKVAEMKESVFSSCQCKDSIVPVQSEGGSPDRTPATPSSSPLTPASSKNSANTRKAQLDGQSNSTVPTIDDILITLTEARDALDEIQEEAERNDDLEGISAESTGTETNEEKANGDIEHKDEEIAVTTPALSAKSSKSHCVEKCRAVKPKKLTIELMPPISIFEEDTQEQEQLPANPPLVMGNTSSKEIASQSFTGQEVSFNKDSLIDYHVATGDDDYEGDDDGDDSDSYKRKKSNVNDMFEDFNHPTARRDTKDTNNDGFDFNYSHMFNPDDLETIIAKPGSTAFKESLKVKESYMYHPIKEVLIRKDDDLVVRVTKTYESVNMPEENNSNKLLFYKTFQVVAEEAPHPLPQHHPGELSLESISQLASTVDEKFYKTFVDPEGLKMSRVALDPNQFSVTHHQPMSDLNINGKEFQCSEQSILMRLLQHKKTPMEMGFYVNKATQWKDGETGEDGEDEVTIDESPYESRTSVPPVEEVDASLVAIESREQSKSKSSGARIGGGPVTDSVQTFHTIPNKVDKSIQVYLESSLDDDSDSSSCESCSSSSSIDVSAKTKSVEFTDVAAEELKVVQESVAESVLASGSQVKDEANKNVSSIEEKSVPNKKRTEKTTIPDRNVSVPILHTSSRPETEKRKSFSLQFKAPVLKTETLAKEQTVENPLNVETELKKRISYLKEVRKSITLEDDFYLKEKKRGSGESGEDKSNDKPTTSMMCTTEVPHCEGDMSHLKFNVRKLPTYSPRCPTLLDSNSDSVTLDESISEGEIRCKCAVSIGEIHSCMQRQQKTSRRKQAVQQPLNKHRLPEQVLRKAFGDSSIKIKSQRMHYANWVSYYVNKGDVNDSSSAS